MNSSFEEETKESQKFAMKVFYGDQEKRIGEKEYRNLAQIEKSPHQGIVRGYGYHRARPQSVMQRGPYNLKLQAGQVVDVNSRGFDSLALEYCANGDLFDIVRGAAHNQADGQVFIMGEQLTKHIMLKVLAAVNHLHT